MSAGGAHPHLLRTVVGLAQRDEDLRLPCLQLLSHRDDVRNVHIQSDGWGESIWHHDRDVSLQTGPALEHDLDIAERHDYESEPSSLRDLGRDLETDRVGPE